MHNHDQKIRDLSRSVLPSTARKMARSTRRHIHHADRQDVAAALRIGDESPRRDRRRELGNLVADRRGADKVAPLLRWARHHVRSLPGLSHAPMHEQVEHFRLLLPDTAIGRHALSHIVWALELDHPNPPYRGYHQRRPRPQDAPIAPLLHAIYEAGLHRELNRRLKVALVRPFLDLHDVEAFAAGAQTEVQAIVQSVAAIAGAGPAMGLTS